MPAGDKTRSTDNFFYRALELALMGLFFFSGSCDSVFSGIASSSMCLVDGASDFDCLNEPFDPMLAFCGSLNKPPLLNVMVGFLIESCLLIVGMSVDFLFINRRSTYLASTDVCFLGTISSKLFALIFFKLLPSFIC